MIRSLIAILLLLGTCAAQARQHPGIDEYLATADRFDRLAASSATPPRLTDPAAAPLLRRLTDGRATFGDARFTWDDLDEVQGVLLRAYAIAYRYGFHGLASGASAAEADRLEVENSLLFQDEIIPFFAIMIEGVAITARVVGGEDFSDDPIAATPEGRASLLETRQGMEAMFSEDLAPIISSPQIRLANRMLVLEALARHAAEISALLSLPQRRRVLAEFQQLRPDLPSEARARFDEILTALASTTCEGTCPL